LEGKYEISNISFADHLAVIAEIRINNKEKKQAEHYVYREMNDSNWLLFNNRLYNLEIGEGSIEDRWSNLLVNIKTIVDECFPLKTTKKKYLFKMSSGLLKCRDKKKLLRKYKAGRLDKNIYIRYNAVYRKLIKHEQTKKFEDQLQLAGCNGKKKWNAIKKTLLISSKKEKIDEIEVGEQLIKDKAAKAFKHHFETCASALAEGLPEGCDTSTIMDQGTAWGFENTSIADLIKIINSLKTKNSSGHDSLTNRMLKKEPYLFARLLQPIINESLNAGVFPSCLKKANILPVFKKGNHLNLNNYRPIALLPVVSKVFEKVINKQLSKVVEESFIDDNQFGFRESHSTEDAVIKFVEKIEQELAANNHVISIYLDVSKAFDSCDHEIIL
jgi:hypothetical protein